jgi:hypothetical protein
VKAGPDLQEIAESSSVDENERVWYLHAETAPA